MNYAAHAWIFPAARASTFKITIFFLAINQNSYKNTYTFWRVAYNDFQTNSKAKINNKVQYILFGIFITLGWF